MDRFMINDVFGVWLRWTKEKHIQTGQKAKPIKERIMGLTMGRVC